MLTPEEDMQVDVLRKRGWTISAIARHLGKDRKTVRAYLSGERIQGVRKPPPDVFAKFESYVQARFRDDVHVPLSTLYDELVDLGFPRSYQSFTRVVRVRGLRPACVHCAGVAGRATIDIPHEPGAECQWDWVELPGAPWLAEGAMAHLLVGTLSFSSRARACFADAEDQPHLIEALDGVLRRLGGTPRVWRFDRMGTVVHVGTDRILPSFAQVAKHYAAEVAVCPPYRGNRKGVVEKGIDFLTQRWWRTADVASPAEAQASLDAFLAGPGDARVRHRDGRRTTVSELAALEGLRPLPARAYPAEVRRETTVDRDATVAFDGNRYGVAPSLIGQPVVVRHRLGSSVVEVVTAAGLVAATHERAPAGAHRVVRTGCSAPRSSRSCWRRPPPRAGRASARPTGPPASRRRPRRSGCAAAPPATPTRRSSSTWPSTSSISTTSTSPTPSNSNSSLVSTRADRARSRLRPLRLHRRGLRGRTPSARAPVRRRRRGGRVMVARTPTADMPDSPPAGVDAPADVYQRLRSHLAYLKLAAAAEALPQALEDARSDDLSHTVFLERLLGVEVDATSARRHAARLQLAGFPAPWRLTDFDFDAQPKLDRRLITDLATLRFVDEAANILFIGPPGVGKTMLAIALGHAAVDAGYRAYYTTAADLAARCHRAALTGRWATTMNFFSAPQVLIVDLCRPRDYADARMAGTAGCAVGHEAVGIWPGTGLRRSA